MDAMPLRSSQLQAALRERMNQTARFEDREQYIGASEVGTCLRKVVLSKRKPAPFDSASIGRMLAGRVMENEVVQLVRIALEGRLRNTGRVQLEFRHPTLPFRAHPDGRITGEFAGTEGDGVLEVKTASTATFKRFRNEGLPQVYLDQVQAQMGLSGMTWGLVVLVSRENLAEVETFDLAFDPEHFQSLVERVVKAAAALQGDNIQKKIEGEPGRGYCHTCPYQNDCEEFCARREAGKRGEVSDLVRFQLEAQLEELASLEAVAEPAQERITEIRDLIKETLQSNEVGKVRLGNGVVQFVDSSRTSFDSKSLQREAPDVYARFLKTNTFSTLRILHKGERPCRKTA